MTTVEPITATDWMCLFTYKKGSQDFLSTYGLFIVVEAIQIPTDCCAYVEYKYISGSGNQYEIISFNFKYSV